MNHSAETASSMALPGVDGGRLGSTDEDEDKDADERN